MTTPTISGSRRSHHGPHKSRFNWMLIGFLAVGGFFLLTEHRAHLLGALPYLLLLACPLLHLFGHGGHGDHGNHNDARGPEDKP